MYLCAGKPPLADIILSHPPELTRCDSVIGLAIPAMSGHIQYRGAASGDLLKVLPWVDVGAGGLGAGKTSGAGTRGVSLDVVIGVGTGYTNTNGGESSDNRSKVHADCGPAENPSL